MSTRSYIGIINKDRSIDAVYCHWDGYPDNQGPILKDSYDSAEKVRKLLSLGSLSALGRNFAPEGKVEYMSVYPYDTTIAYCRDLGEEMEDAVHFDSRKAFLDWIRSTFTDYIYLYNEGLSAWMFAKIHISDDKPIRLRRLEDKDIRRKKS